MMPPLIDLNSSGFDVIEHGIRNLVRTLWGKGYQTACSCAGHRGGLEPLPWVAISAARLTPEQLPRLVMAISLFNASQGEKGQLPEAANTWVLSPQYLHRELVLYLRPQSLNETESREEILRLRKLGEELARFIENEC